MKTALIAVAAFFAGAKICQLGMLETIRQIEMGYDPASMSTIERIKLSKKNTEEYGMP